MVAQPETYRSGHLCHMLTPRPIILCNLAAQRGFFLRSQGKFSDKIIVDYFYHILAILFQCWKLAVVAQPKTYRSDHLYHMLTRTSIILCNLAAQRGFFLRSQGKFSDKIILDHKRAILFQCWKLAVVAQPETYRSDHLCHMLTPRPICIFSCYYR